MKRETSNKIRTIIEDFLPPVLKDTVAFQLLASVTGVGSYVRRSADFRARAPFLTEREYIDFYKASPRIHSETDNSKACIDRTTANILGDSVCDVGCGTGYLLHAIKAKNKQVNRFLGVEIVPPVDSGGIQFLEGKVESIPLPDKSIDTVVCTHVIEHILDHRAAIAELRRIARKRLIIVVPREREGYYSFNPHFNFFPYPHSFLRFIIPVPNDHICELIGRDIYYQETI